MALKQDNTYLAVRNRTVVKANELIQKSRFNLSLQQQKIVLYLISQITAFDEDFKLYEFSINEFCKVCGIDDTSGKNYTDLKNAIKDIKLKYYQDLNVSIARDNSGITLSKSNSIILNNDCRYVLVTSSL